MCHNRMCFRVLFVSTHITGVKDRERRNLTRLAEATVVCGVSVDNTYVHVYVYILYTYMYIRK